MKKDYIFINIKDRWVIYLALLLIITLLLINKFPIIVELKENKQIWETNCQCECIAQKPESCINWTFEKPEVLHWVNYSYTINLSEKCRFCWIYP